MSTSSAKTTVNEAYKLNKRALHIWWSKYPKIFISSSIYALFSSLIPFVAIYLSAKIINELAGGRDAEILSTLVAITLIATSLLSIAKAILQHWKNSEHSCLYHKEQKIFSDKLLSMDFSSVDDPYTSDLICQINQNENWSGWGLKRLIDNYEKLLSSIIQICGAITLTVSLFTSSVPEKSGTLIILNSPIFAFIIVVLMLIVTVVSPGLSNKANSYWAKCADKATMSNRMFGFYGFMAFDHNRALDIRIYRQDILCKNSLLHDNAFGPKGDIAKHARGAMGLLNMISSAVSYIFTAIVYVFVCLKAWGGAFGAGSVTQYISAITSLSNGVSSFISTLGDMKNNSAFLKVVFEFLDIPNNMYQGSLTVEKRNDRKYEIEFKDVSFKYPNSNTWALHHVSMKFKIGSRLAVVGQNGSGKTTFVKLLCRLYDPTQGHILLNGIDIRKYNYDEYISVFSVVFQDFKLFAFPLGENVAASFIVDNNRAEKSLIESGFQDKLLHMPKGMNTFLYKSFDETGVDVSGGEAQKIAIARSLYKDAPFMILDEPTAALDPVAEYEIYSKFNEIVGDKTAVYISHRLSSCRFCDEIAVFHEGQVVQQGNHETLVADFHGKYYELWNAQAQYYIATNQ